jgi:rod shape-determining protein MreC
LTSGIGGRFPSGFPVGTIRSVQPAPGGAFLLAHATPAANIDRADDVLLLHDLADPQGPPAPEKPVGPPADLAPAASSGAVRQVRPGSAGTVPTPARPVSGAQP